MESGSSITRTGRMLSIDPRTDRVAWTFLQDGVIRDKCMHTARIGEPADRVRQLIVPYLVRLLDSLNPHALIVPDIASVGGRRRSSNVAEVIRSVTAHATQRGISVHVINTLEIKRLLTDAGGRKAKNKCDVHRRIVEQYPEMLAVMPRPRLKAWEPERYFEPLFNTIAMYLAWLRKPSPMDRRRTS
jgi:hypothetical protein